MFQEKYALLNEDDTEETYRRRNDEEKKAVSWGQRKLLMALLNFILNLDIKNLVIVYAGAAPGVNIGIVADLFPNIVWHLYDPAKFSLKTDLKRKILIYNKKFTDETAKYWANKDVVFISDIRTADYTKAENLTENENQILTDMEMQKRWVEIIKPIRTQLKFRLSYTGDGRKEEMEYFDGLIYKQCWAPNTSSETRLVLTDSEFKYKTYNCKKYESQMFYHNVHIREENRYENDVVDGEELINDWDSCYEVEIWKKYLKFIGKEINRENIIELSKNATKLLTKDRKYKDTLSYLRSHPQAIKNRNFNKK